MENKKFIRAYIIVFIISLLSIYTFHYFIIDEEVKNYLPKTWGDPISISKGNINREMGMDYLNGEYAIAHIDNETIITIIVSDTGEILNTTSIPLDNKFIDNIDVAFNETTNDIFITYTQRVNGVDYFKILNLNHNLEKINLKEIQNVKLSKKLNGNIYTLVYEDRIEIVDILTMEIISTEIVNGVEELETLQVDNTSYAVYMDKNQVFYCISYVSRVTSEPKKLFQITNKFIYAENLRLVESNGNLNIIVEHLDKSFSNAGDSLGDFIYRYSLEDNTITEAISIKDCTESTENPPMPRVVIKNHPEIKFLGTVTEKIGRYSNRENVIRFTINMDNLIVPIGTVTSFSKYYKYGTVEHEAIFYVEYEKHDSMILKMVSQNEDYIKKYASNDEYEKSIINNLFIDEFISSLVMIIITLMGFICISTIAIFFHMFLNSKFMDQKGPILLVANSIFIFICKISILGILFYGSNRVFLPPIINSFLVCILLNVIISLIVFTWNIHRLNVNDTDISYPEMFALFLLDMLVSMIIFYPSIF